jgi:hypothetical protein
LLVCACCGESQIEFLTLDHINNDGNSHRKEIGFGGSGLYRWAESHGYPPVLQVMCMNCNWGKRLLGYCPHKNL